VKTVKFIAQQRIF